jgi:hypothetical protein
MQNSDLKFYHPLVINNTTTNGSRMSANQIISGVLQNVFPHVFKAERDAGSTITRKIYGKNADDADGTLFNAAFCIDGTTLGDDWCYFWAGTQRDTAADITGSERKYGGGLSTTTLTAGSSQTVTVEVKSTTVTGVFANADKIRITNKATPDSGTGTEQWVTINGAPSVSGHLVTITFTEALTDSYAIGSKISSIYFPGDVKTSLGTISKTGSGTYDDTTYPWVLDNIGTTDEDITCTFTDATHFTVTGDSLGSLGSGIIGTVFTYTNPGFSKPSFTIPVGFWTGTWATGNTLSRTIHPSAAPLWERKITPAGANSMSNNKITMISSGEAV